MKDAGSNHKQFLLHLLCLLVLIISLWFHTLHHVDIINLKKKVILDRGRNIFSSPPRQ
jgi:hypothetical protein